MTQSALTVSVFGENSPHLRRKARFLPDRYHHATTVDSPQWERAAHCHLMTVAHSPRPLLGTGSARRSATAGVQCQRNSSASCCILALFVCLASDIATLITFTSSRSCGSISDRCRLLAFISPTQPYLSPPSFAFTLPVEHNALPPFIAQRVDLCLTIWLAMRAAARWTTRLSAVCAVSYLLTNHR